MPTERQIETVARALFDYRLGAGAWDIANHPGARNTLGVQQRLDDVRVDASVAIAAMPQPIGYAFVYTDGDVCWSTVADESAGFATELAAMAAAEGDAGTVVALVPVEVQP